MNKKLLTLAIGAALVSAPMFANAAATVYGVAHLSIDMLDNGNATNSDLLTLSNNSSYLGFKAEEDLGGGTKALFGAEIQWGLDNAVSGNFNRNVFVG
ncbi:MAG: porin, partial [Proteobacteria bacterium]|nr:porin [Pseudomonadota bacterium]